MQETGVACTPLEAIGLKNAKSVANTETLELSGRTIGWLTGLESFSNLKYLWLNRNLLSSLVGLESNWRLHGLYAAFNRIGTLCDSPLAGLLQLEELVLNDNRIDKLHAQLEVLHRLRRLRRLDLYNNPVAEETNYRLHIIKALPWLQVLDRVKVSNKERATAAKVKVAKFELEAETRSGALSEAANRRKRSPEEQRRVAAIATYLRKKRVKLRPHWVEMDRRRLGYVEPEQFELVLLRYGIEPSAELLDAYAMTALRGGRVIDYERFCHDTEPELFFSASKSLGRNVGKISACVRLAEVRARIIRERKARARTKTHRNEVFLDSVALIAPPPAYQRLWQTELIEDLSTPRHLTSWEISELERGLQAAASPPDVKLNRDDAERVFEHFGELIGRKCQALNQGNNENAQRLIGLGLPNEAGKPSSFLWERISPAEARTKSDRLFNKAAQLQRQSMLSDDPAVQAKTRAHLADLITRATKLQCIAGAPEQASELLPGFELPHRRNAGVAQNDINQPRLGLDKFSYVRLDPPKPMRPPKRIGNITANAGLSSSYCSRRDPIELEDEVATTKNGISNQRTPATTFNYSEIETAPRPASVATPAVAPSRQLPLSRWTHKIPPLQSVSYFL